MLAVQYVCYCNHIATETGKTAQPEVHSGFSFRYGEKAAKPKPAEKQTQCQIIEMTPHPTEMKLVRGFQATL